MTWTALTVLVALLEYLAFVGAVGRARARHGVAAPAVTGHPAFERAFRVQQNTVELLVALVPSAFLFAWYVSDVGAAGLVAIYVVGRAIYFRAYTEDPARRGPGMLVSATPIAVLALGALAGVVADVF